MALRIFFVWLALGLPVAQAETVAQIGDLFPVVGNAPEGSHAWPGNNGLNTNNGVGNHEPNARNIKDTSGTGSWTVGWLEDWELAEFGNPLDSPVTTLIMGGWIYPNSTEVEDAGQLGEAQGYSWAGSHDIGWMDNVGFHADDKTQSLVWRSNVKSPPFLQWTTSKSLEVDVVFTVGNLSSSYDGERFFFGIWSSAAKSYVGDNPSYLPKNSGIPLTTTPSDSLKISAFKVKMKEGDSLWFVARSLMPVGEATRIEFQSINITTASATTAD